MAFLACNLKLLENTGAATGGGEVNGVYTLVTNDTAATVEGDGYLDGALDDGLKAGDMIMALLDKDGTPMVKFYHVTAGGADVAIRGLGASITALTYDLVAGTANNALQALADGTTYANDVAAIRNNFADLAAKIEELRDAITV